MVSTRDALRVGMVTGALVCAACSSDAPESGTAAMEASPATTSANRIVQLLAAGEPVLGVSSGKHTPEQGAAMATNLETDFVFYSLEDPPFDIQALAAYKQAMHRASGPAGPRPLALRVPPVRDGREDAAEHVRQALEAGVDGIVFPHASSKEDAELAVHALGEELWPGNPDGRLVAMLIIEDTEGVEHVREIVGTPGISVVFAGPGDLRRAYDGDKDAVEQAIQAVLAACKEFDVPCGITAGVKDIAKRLHEGFRVVIVLQPEALAVGLEASGRN